MAIPAPPRYSEWLPSGKTGELSDALADSPPVRAAREAARLAFEELDAEPNPLYRKYVYFAGVDLRRLDATSTGPPVPLPPAPADTVRIVHDGSGTRVEIPPAVVAAGVTVRSLPEIYGGTVEGRGERESVAAAEDKLAALSLALINRAVQLTVPDGCTLPIRVQDLTILSRPRESLSVRRRLSVGAGARLLYTEETYCAHDATHEEQQLYASTMDVRVADDARALFTTVHAPSAGTVGLYQRRATVGNHGQLTWLWNGLGGFRTRMKNRSELVGQGSNLLDLQTFYGDRVQAYDSSVTIQHRGTDTHGQSITRGVFRDEARGVSRGLVRIEKEAVKTISVLSEHAMLLSRGARSDTIPVLEILCRDVKATHSSSVAPVDPERIFYLESRGITEADAIRMIGEGFLAHVLDRAPLGGLREALYPMFEARWNQQPIRWAAGEFPALPALTVTSENVADEWRFDSKLR